MADDAIGYGRPPKSTQFKPGTSGNRNGRPRRTPDGLGEVVLGVLDAPVQYRENGRTRTATRREVALKVILEKAVKGDVVSAALLLKKRKHALKHGKIGAQQLVVTDWLPDYPGQTAEEKTAAMAAQMGAVPPRRRSGRRPDGRENDIGPAGSTPQEQEG